MDHPGSAVTAIANLEPGGSVCRSRFITQNLVSSALLYQTKRDLTNIVTKAVSRAKLRNPAAVYRIHSFHNLTAQLDMVIVTVVVRNE
jgi:hypothetical protein